MYLEHTWNQFFKFQYIFDNTFHIIHTLAGLAGLAGLADGLHLMKINGFSTLLVHWVSIFGISFGVVLGLLWGGSGITL